MYSHFFLYTFPFHCLSVYTSTRLILSYVIYTYSDVFIYPCCSYMYEVLDSLQSNLYIYEHSSKRNLLGWSYGNNVIRFIMKNVRQWSKLHIGDCVNVHYVIGICHICTVLCQLLTCTFIWYFYDYLAFAGTRYH